jgi:glycerate 2-kinase
LIEKFHRVKILRSQRNESLIRRHAISALEHALLAAEPGKIIERKISLVGRKLNVGPVTVDFSKFNRVLVIGGGKASSAMALAIERILGTRLTGGIINVPVYTKPWPKSKIIQFHEATHPIPSQAGVKGVQKMLELVGEPKEDDLVICLISGGGSSLLPLPQIPITLADIQNTTGFLLRSGAEINEINTIRKHLSAIKGGRLAAKLFPATVLALIISDVVGDRLDSVASGPTVPDPTTYSDTFQILRKYDLLNKVPRRVKEEITRGLHEKSRETPKPGSRIFDRVHNILVGTNRSSCLAAATHLKKLGYHTLVLSTQVQGEAKEVGKIYAGILHGMRSGTTLPPPCAIVAGGETTVTIKDGGKGGRNQELVLSAALNISGLKNVVIASMGTDGVDGPTDAAGSIADGQTLERAERLNLEPKRFLETHNSYLFFKKLGGLIVTGPTGTNVNDVMVLLAGKD